MSIPRLFMICLVFIVSCQSNDDNSSDPNNIDQTDDGTSNPGGTEDSDMPLITVNGNLDSIETYEYIGITIEDESVTETKILLDDEVLFSSSEKQIEYSFNPYPIAIGIHTLTVESTDEFGNLNSRSFQIDIKHLLMIYNLGVQEFNRHPQTWLFFNQLNGTPIKTLKTELGQTKIYTDLDIEDDYVFYSIADYNVYESQSAKELYVTSNKISLGHERFTIIRPENDLSEELEVSVERDHQQFGYTDVWAQGTLYRPSYLDGLGFTEKVGIRFDPRAEDLYLRITDSGTITFLDEDPVDFKYVEIDLESDMNQLMFREDEFKIAEKSTLSIPDHDAGTLLFRGYGFKDLAAIEENISHNILDLEENLDYVARSIPVPKYEGLEHYDYFLYYDKGDRQYWARGFNEDFDVEMPEWNVSTELTNESLTVTGENTEVDYYSVRLLKYEETEDESTYFVWNYRVFDNQNSVDVVPRLQLPMEISESIGEDYFRSADDLKLDRTSAIDYRYHDKFDDLTVWLSFIEINPTVDKLPYRRVNFLQDKETMQGINPTIEKRRQLYPVR